MAPYAPNNPLQLGQVIYPISGFQLVGWTAVSGSQPGTTGFIVGSASPPKLTQTPAMEGKLYSRAVTDLTTQRQSIFMLNSDTLTRCSGDSVTTWPIDPTGISLIIDLDPNTPPGGVWTPRLLMAGQDAAGVFLVAFDVTSGVLSGRTRVTLATGGTLLDACFIRCQLMPRLLLLTSGDSRISAQDAGYFDSKTLEAPLTCRSSVIVTGALAANPTLSIAPAQLSTTGVNPSLGVGNQQLVIATGDDAQSAFVSICYLQPAGADFALQATAPLALDLVAWSKDVKSGLGVPAHPMHLCVTAGDLLVSGVDQIFIGYTGAYAGVGDCACILLLEFKEGAGLQVVPQSGYSVRQTNVINLGTPDIPFCTNGLSIAAGIFAINGPPTLMVSGRSPRCKGGNDQPPFTYLGFIPVRLDPLTRQFSPPMATAPDGTPTGAAKHEDIVADTSSKQVNFYAVTLNADHPVFWAPCDYLGESVVLGPPTLTQTSDAMQILAIIQAIPFENNDEVMVSPPSLTVVNSNSSTDGYSVSSTQSWMYSKDLSSSMTVDALTLSRHTSKSYGTGFSAIQDNTTTQSVTALQTIGDADIIITYQNNYDIWTYPIYQRSQTSEAAGSLAVVFPTSPTLTTTYIPANDEGYGYLPQSQPGSLLSYLDVSKLGYAPDKLLFKPVTMSVLTSNNSNQLSYDQSSMTTSSESMETSVHNSSGNSESFGFSADLMSYLPASFGLHISNSYSYSASETKTTAQSRDQALSLQFSFGSVSDPEYRYSVKPYVYWHDTMGCMMVAYDIELHGALWAAFYAKPRLMLIALNPFDKKTPVLAVFSRSITFRPAVSGGAVDVDVQVFNASTQSPATNIVCRLCRGKPTVGDGMLLPPSEDSTIAETSLDSLAPCQRVILTLPACLAAGETSCVTVVFTYEEQEADAPCIYWGVYPMNQYPYNRGTLR